MKKIGLIILIAIVALGAMGAGYAVWQQTLNITGTATVATFSVSMTCDAPTKPADSDNTTITAVPTATTVTYNSTGNAGLTVTITNAVPGVYKITGVTVHNDSTIPLKISVDAVTGTDLTSTGTQVNDTDFVTAATLDHLAVGATTTATDITITIGDSVTQKATLNFQIPVTATQS